MRRLVSDQCLPVHPVSESRGGSLSVTYRAAGVVGGFPDQSQQISGLFLVWAGVPLYRTDTIWGEWRNGSFLIVPNTTKLRKGIGKWVGGFKPKYKYIQFQCLITLPDFYSHKYPGFQGCEIVQTKLKCFLRIRDQSNS